jgi:hypothetical protein
VQTAHRWGYMQFMGLVTNSWMLLNFLHVRCFCDSRILRSLNLAVLLQYLHRFYALKRNWFEAGVAVCLWNVLIM